jgi:hypothetical protein
MILEPISKLPEEDNETGELNEAKEVLWMIFPSDEDPALKRSTNQRRKKRRRRRRSCVGGFVRFERCGAIISMRIDSLQQF